MWRITLAGFMLFLLFAALGADTQPASKSAIASPVRRAKPPLPSAPTGTLQKLIVENGSVTMQLDLNRLSASTLRSLPAAAGSNDLTAVPFTIAANSFFTIVVFNDELRGAEQGSMALLSAEAAPNAFGAAGLSVSQATRLPPQFGASLNRLVVEKLSPDQGFDLVVRDASTGFTFFNVEGAQYDYDAKAQSLTIRNGWLLLSREFASALGRPSDAGAVVGQISAAATMQPIEIRTVINGATKSLVLPPLQGDRPMLVPGPDVIVGDLPQMNQQGAAGTQVGLVVATTSCNQGDQPLHWFQLPQTDHPVIPQNFYRLSGGEDNNERFEQIGQSWLKHAFFALEGNACNFGCNTSGCTTGSDLCPGCSDPYSTSNNGDQNGLGSRAWVNPFTGAFPSNANDHTGHSHDGVSHRIRVEVNDLDPAQNPGATYFAEGQYVTPHEYAWCQSHPGQCNMFNNVSYRQFTVSGGPSSFTFSAAGSTVRMQPAIMAWPGATVSQYQPDPGNDGIWFMGYKVTNPSAGVWHYEYALYNENLDRAIQSFSVPLGAGVNISNIGFHAPPQEPGWANDGTFNNQGYSSVPWSVTQVAGSITWNCETIAQNQNANAIRWGTLYNFRFDADQPPQAVNATVGYFKTGAPSLAPIQAPAGIGTPTPTPTVTATPTLTPAPTPTATATATPTATPTATATATATPTLTATATPTLSPTPTATPTATPTPTATATATLTPTPTATVSPTPTATTTPTATPTPTATATATPRPTPTPRGSPRPRIRPTPLPRP